MLSQAAQAASFNMVVQPIRQRRMADHDVWLDNKVYHNAY